MSKQNESPESGLPASWVTRIFDKLALTYGRDFLIRWEGQDMALVKDDWGHELRHLQQNPSAIRYGLANLPESKPPTVLEFRALCARRPDEAPQALPAPPADPERVKKALAGLSLMSTNIPARAAEWRARMYELRRTGAATRAQLDAIKQFEANRGGGEDVASIGDFTAVPASSLPPEMRAAA